MNFLEKLANYKLGNLNWGHLPEIALSAMSEGFESESLNILAGMTESDNPFELESFFKKALYELQIDLPDNFTAAVILLKFYLSQIVEQKDDPYKIAIIIDNEIYKQINWLQELNLDKKEFVGEELGLEKLYTWYRELSDFNDGGRLLYFNDLPRDEQKTKIEKELISEASMLLAKLKKNNYTQHGQ